MNEQLWLESEDPAELLDFVIKYGQWSVRVLASKRKLRLWACACCRQVWARFRDDSICDRCGGDRYEDLSREPCSTATVECLACSGTGEVNSGQRAVEMAERYADGEVDEAVRRFELNRIIKVNRNNNGICGAAWVKVIPESALEDPIYLPRLVNRAKRSGIQLATQAALLREIFGNPFRPIRQTHPCPDCGSDGHFVRKNGERFDCRSCGGTGDLCVWLTPAVRQLAEAIYTSRNFGALPVLADAAEEAGCEDEGILRHLRGFEQCHAHFGMRSVGYSDASGRPTCRYCDNTNWQLLRAPHALGCWALDLILGKE